MGLNCWLMALFWKFMGDICGPFGFCAGDDVCIRCCPIWPCRKFWFDMVGDGVWVKPCCCWKPNWGCCDGVWERDWMVPWLSLFAPASEPMGKPRAPFICGFASALGSMKLDGSYMPFGCGDWPKSMVRGWGWWTLAACGVGREGASRYLR